MDSYCRLVPAVDGFSARSVTNRRRGALLDEKISEVARGSSIPLQDFGHSAKDETRL